MYMELEVQCTCMYDPNKCFFYISKTSYGEMVYTLFMSYMARDNILINIH